MDINQISANQALAKLQDDFKRNLPKKISDIKLSWEHLCEDKLKDFADLHMKIHSLVGTSGTFGASTVSITARKLEDYIKPFLQDSKACGDDCKNKIESLILQIQNISEKWLPTSFPPVSEKKTTQGKTDAGWKSNIYLVEDDVEVAEPMIQYLEKGGYQVFYYQEIIEFKKEYKKNEKAAAIIMDMTFDEGVIAGAETIKELSKNESDFPPVIYSTVHNDIEARLAAAQSGAAKYFVKPVDENKLITCLDELTYRVKKEAYRILLVDDEQEVLDYYSEVLRGQGMNVLAFTDPFEAYDSITHFSPELIALDLYMPKCSGFDLAKVIRQDDDLATIPIVFLSSELDTQTQISAMELGGDDFIMKNNDIDCFSKVIALRVKRSREVYQLYSIVKDTSRESENRLITLEEHAIISMTDVDGTITFVNKHFMEISGYSEDELLGKNHNILKSGFHEKSFYKNLWEIILSGSIWHGQVCNKKKNGELYWVEATIVPFINENGETYKYVSIRTDITKIKESEKSARNAEKRLTKQQETLNTLTNAAGFILLEENKFYEIIVQRAAETLKVERVSLWTLDDKNDSLICAKQYTLSDGSWGDGMNIDKANNEDYFSMLNNNTVLSSDGFDAHLTKSNFDKDYVNDLDITAMLHIPIRRNGEFFGAICCDHIRSERTWYQDEISFISSLSNLLLLNYSYNERKEIELELLKSKETADVANKAKSTFLSNMSHELRTPMNAVSGFAQLILMDLQDNEDITTKEYAEEIIAATKHLLALINSILELSKIDAGSVELSKEMFLFYDVVLEGTSLMLGLINSRALNLNYKVNGNNITAEELSALELPIFTDRLKLKQVILNLLSNAVKYNKKGGDLSIEFDVTENAIRTNIIDSGIGIAKESIDDVFKPFYRIESSKDNTEGTGIGLVITRELVGLMGGSVGAESEANKGSKFWFELPTSEKIE